MDYEETNSSEPTFTESRTSGEKEDCFKESPSALTLKEAALKLPQQPQPLQQQQHHHRHHHHQRDSCHIYRDLLLSSGDSSGHPPLAALSDRASSVSFDISTSSARSSTDSVYGDREEESVSTSGSGQSAEPKGDRPKENISSSGTPQTVLAQDGAVADLSILQCPFCSRAFLGLYELNEQLEQARAEAAALRQQLAKLMPTVSVGDHGELGCDLPLPAGGSLGVDDYLSSTTETTMEGTGTIGSAHFFLSEETPTSYSSSLDLPERIGLPRVMDQALAKLAGDVDPLSPEEEDDEGVAGASGSQSTMLGKLQNGVGAASGGEATKGAAAAVVALASLATAGSGCQEQPRGEEKEKEEVREEDSVRILCIGDGAAAAANTMTTTTATATATAASTAGPTSLFTSTTPGKSNLELAGLAGSQMPWSVGGYQEQGQASQGSQFQHTTGGVPISGTPASKSAAPDQTANSGSYKMVIVAPSSPAPTTRSPGLAHQASAPAVHFLQQATALLDEGREDDSPTGPPPSSSGPGKLISQQLQQQEDEAQPTQHAPHTQPRLPPRRVVQLRPAVHPQLPLPMGHHQHHQHHPHHQPNHPQHRPPHCPQAHPPLLVFKEGRPAPGSIYGQMPDVPGVSAAAAVATAPATTTATAASAAAAATATSAASRGLAVGPYMVQVAMAPPVSVPVAAPGAP